MIATPTTNFLAGVIEGFYGQPWSQAERVQLFDWMKAWGLNTYLYAPKDDLKHRAFWREIYSETEADVFRQLVSAARQRGIQFIYALSPGLDICYSREADLQQLQTRFAQMLALGCQNFALLFDDIPDRMNAADLQRWGSFAAAQCHLTNTLFRWTRERCPTARFLFCPTPYCGRMAAAQLGGPDYLSTLGRELLPEIDVFWTGPEIISREITVAHVQELQTRLRRKPVIWDNLHANDYDGRRFFCGPYAGRPLELRSAVPGLLLNPNNEFPLNYVPFRTFAAFINCGVAEWNPRAAYESAMREWLPYFATVGAAVDLPELLFFGDSYYLPHQEGDEAEQFFTLTRTLLGTPPTEWGEMAVRFRHQASRLREFCVRMTELRDRPLFYALSRRIWELREELDLLERYVAFKSNPANHSASFTSDFHQPGTYRGGLVARLQRLLRQHADGTFTPQ